MKILSINSGSSSLKFGIYNVEDGEAQVLYSGEVEGIGAEQSKTSLKDASGKALGQNSERVADQEAAFQTFAKMYHELKMPLLRAVGHRLVHGGPKLQEHRQITPWVLQELEAAAHFAPLHLPNALHLIRLAQMSFPALPHFACFDTAFHRTLPEAAARFALPEAFWEGGVRRYGFHGLSCESILHRLGGSVPRNLIVAHLGSGASLTAIANGKSVDTTMGLTPTGGIVMATRTGDLDPGVILHILRKGSNWTTDSLETLVDQVSGLRGLSGRTGGMRELRKHANDPRARMAMEIFCRSAKKAVGSLVAILGGIDLLVFAGGIGENDAESRTQICDGLGVLGIELDADANRNGGPTVSAKNSKAEVRVIPSDEDGQIARITAQLVSHLDQ